MLQPKTGCESSSWPHGQIRAVDSHSKTQEATKTSNHMSDSAASSKSSKSSLRRRLSSLKYTLTKSLSSKSRPTSTVSTKENTQLAPQPESKQNPQPQAKMSLPETYKHAVFKEQGKPLVLEDVPLQLPKPGEILIKVEACGVCYSDMYAQHNGMGDGL